jgi:hypothetical protein
MSNERGVGSRAAQLAVLAAKAAKIAAAASAGGPYGAGAETVRQFLPLLIKIVIIIAVTLLLLPSLIYMAIPHHMFGWADSGSLDVRAMSERAIGIGRFYDDQYDDTIGRVVAGYVDRLLLPDNPYTTVNVNLGNTNRTWLIAIISVYYAQDLEIINYNAILHIVEKMLVSNVAAGNRHVTISITDLTPDALMALLEFSDEQCKWAHFIVSVMNEDQVIDPSDIDYSGGGMNYSDITFTNGSTEVTYYRTPGGVMSHTEETAEWAFQNGYRVEGNGSMHALIPRGAEHYGLTVEGVS